MLALIMSITLWLQLHSIKGMQLTQKVHSKTFVKQARLFPSRICITLKKTELPELDYHALSLPCTEELTRAYVVQKQ